MFEIDSRLGNPIVFAHFDRRVLLSLKQVILEVRRAAGVSLTSKDLMRMGYCGWIPIVSHAGDLGVEIGTPLYVPLRIQLFLDLINNGYSEAELRIIANYEEIMIDFYIDVVGDIGFPYIDDGLQLIIWHLKHSLLNAEKNGKDTILFNSSDTPTPCSEVERILSRCEQFEREGIPETRQNDVAKWVFSLREYMENVRIACIGTYRGEMRSGYSPFIISNKPWIVTKEASTLQFQAIDWDATIRSAVGWFAEDDVPTIRVPSFLLRGDTVVSLKTLIPRQYHQLWNHYGLDQYLLCWSVLQGEKRCLNCLSKLVNYPRSRRMYCDEKCRNALKQKRFRIANPQAIFETQRKYWTTIPE